MHGRADQPIRAQPRPVRADILQWPIRHSAKGVSVFDAWARKDVRSDEEVNAATVRQHMANVGIENAQGDNECRLICQSSSTNARTGT